MNRASLHVSTAKTWGMVKWEHGTANLHGNGALGGTCSLGVRTNRSHAAKQQV